MRFRTVSARKGKSSKGHRGYKKGVPRRVEKRRRSSKENQFFFFGVKRQPLFRASAPSTVVLLHFGAQVQRPRCHRVLSQFCKECLDVVLLLLVAVGRKPACMHAPTPLDFMHVMLPFFTHTLVLMLLLIFMLILVSLFCVINNVYHTIILVLLCMLLLLMLC